LILARVDGPESPCYNRIMSQILRAKVFPSGTKLQIVQGDITQENVDGIVNAANAHLRHGGGVARLISRKGGPEIQRESQQWVREHGPVSHAVPAYTTGGRLPCKYVIHAVGPIWGSGDEDQKLAAAITGSLQVAAKLDLESIALPAISTGIFGFPKDRAARIIFTAISDYCTKNPDTTLELVYITLFDQPTVDVFLSIWDKKF
jgi:O-acetyl-ADP-ribose deacetylase